MKIVLLEDHETAAAALAKLLAEYGEVHTVSMGADALSFCVSAYEGFEPVQFLLAESKGVGTSGIRTLEEIKKYESQQRIDPSSRIKIVLMNESDDIKDVLVATRAGADGYLKKPVGEYALDQQMELLGFRKRMQIPK